MSFPSKKRETGVQHCFLYHNPQEYIFHQNPVHTLDCTHLRVKQVSPNNTHNTICSAPRYFSSLVPLHFRNASCKPLTLASRGMCHKHKTLGYRAGKDILSPTETCPHLTRSAKRTMFSCGSVFKAMPTYLRDK